MEHNNKCRFCKQALRDIKDDWVTRGAHKKCWKENEKIDSLINYLKVAKYIPANYKSAIELLEI